MASYQFIANGENLVAGTIVSGSWANTIQESGSVVIDPTLSAIDYELTANVGAPSNARDLTELYIEVNLEGGGTITVQMYDYVAVNYVNLPGGSITQTTEPTVRLWHQAQLSQDFVDTNGDVLIRFIGVGIQNNKPLSIYQMRGGSADEGEVPLTAASIANATASLLAEQHSPDSWASRDLLDDHIVSVTSQSEFVLDSIDAAYDDSSYQNARVQIERYEEIAIGTQTTFDPTEDAAKVDFSNGDKTATKNDNQVRGWGVSTSTKATTTGQYYVEYTFAATPTLGPFAGVGIARQGYTLGNDLGQAQDQCCYFANGGRYINSVWTPGWTTPFLAGDVVGIAIDFIGNNIEYFVNDVSVGSFAITLTPDVYYVVAQLYSPGDAATGAWDAAEQNYAPPSGFIPWEENPTEIRKRIGFGVVDTWDGLTKTLTLNTAYSNIPFTLFAGDYVRIIDVHADASAIASQPALQVLDALFTTPAAEGYAALGAEASVHQLLYMILSILLERNIVGTALTSRQLDGVTQAMQFLLDDANNPTDQTRTG